MDDQSTTYRPGVWALDCERLSPAFLRRCDRARQSGQLDDGRKPSQNELRDYCTDCNEWGLIGTGIDASACPHYHAWILLVARGEGVPIVHFRKPAWLAGAAS